jgi:hypothetical protein
MTSYPSNHLDPSQKVTITLLNRLHFPRYFLGSLEYMILVPEML